MSGCETCLGFFKFLDYVTNIHGAIPAETGLEGGGGFAIS